MVSVAMVAQVTRQARLILAVMSVSVPELHPVHTSFTRMAVGKAGLLVAHTMAQIHIPAAVAVASVAHLATVPVAWAASLALTARNMAQLAPMKAPDTSGRTLVVSFLPLAAVARLTLARKAAAVVVRLGSIVKTFPRWTARTAQRRVEAVALAMVRAEAEAVALQLVQAARVGLALLVSS